MHTAVEHGYWERTVECMPRSELNALQLDLLQKTAAYATERVPFYQHHLKQAGVSPEQLRTLDDLRRLPFTTKHDLAEQHPFGTLAASSEEVVRIHASSGTTGNPKVVTYTKRDIDKWSDLVARIAIAAGVRKRDVAPW